jgi:HK97 family phage major capsid protein
MLDNADKLIDLYYVHIDPKTKWLMDNTTYDRIRRLVDGCGTPIMQLSWRDGLPDRLLGHRIEIVDREIYLAFVMDGKTYEFQGGIDGAVVRSIDGDTETIYVA